MKPASRFAVIASAALVGRATAQCDNWHSGPFEPTEPGANGYVGAATTWDPDGAGPLPTHLVVAGSFTEICGIPAESIAVWNGVHWSPLGEGLWGPVHDLTVFNGELVACGGVVGNVARWYLGGWVPISAPVAGGVSPHVGALAVYNGQLIAAGEFTSIGGVAANNIARWTGASWAPLSAGLFGGSFPLVYDLAVYNGELVAGGLFTIAGLGSANNIARWNGTVWQPLGGGTSAAPVSGGVSSPSVYSLAVYNGGLFAGGRFTNAGGVDCGRIARWNGSIWQPLQTGLAGGVNLTAPSVNAMTVYNGALIVGGDFTGAGLVVTSGIAGWNGTSWFSLGTGVHDPLLPSVHALTVHANQLVVGGNFDNAGGVVVRRIARWNGSSWLAFQSPWFVYAFAPLGSRIVAGGYFAQPTGSAEPAAYHVAAWDGVSLTTLGQGFDTTVRALRSFTQSGPLGATELVCGGSFTRAGGTPANRIARWVDVGAFPPPEWTPMGAGFNSTVYAVERFNGGTVAAGDFTASGTTAVNRIASWNGSAWQPFASGLNGTVFALKAVPGSVASVDLVVGGAFTDAGGVPANRIARWVQSIISGSASWSAMGAGFNASVRAVERHDNATYAAGDFTASGAATVNRIARWTGSAWVDVGGGFNGPVYAIKSIGGFLYAAGAFTAAGGVPAQRIARWDGLSWAEVRGGADSSVFALGTFQTEVHAGGAFLHAGAGALSSPGWARYTTTGVPWIVSQPVPDQLACGGSAEFGARPASGYGVLNFRWRKGGAPLANGPTGSGSTISGASGVVTGGSWATLGVSGVSLADQGAYDCVFTASCGAVTSNAAVLTVSGCCYPDCNADGSLTVADFGCFQSKYAAQDPYADCNHDGQLSVGDFGCFQTGFAAGCP